MGAHDSFLRQILGGVKQRRICDLLTLYHIWVSTEGQESFINTGEARSKLALFPQEQRKPERRNVPLIFESQGSFRDGSVSLSGNSEPNAIAFPTTPYSGRTSTSLYLCQPSRHVREDTHFPQWCPMSCWQESSPSFHTSVLCTKMEILWAPEPSACRNHREPHWVYIHHWNSVFSSLSPSGCFWRATKQLSFEWKQFYQSSAMSPHKEKKPRSLFKGTC